MMMGMMLKMLKGKIKESGDEKGEEMLKLLENGINGFGEKELEAVVEFLSLNINTSVLLQRFFRLKENRKMNKYLKNLNRIEFVVTMACTGKCKHCSQGEHKGSDSIDKT